MIIANSYPTSAGGKIANFWNKCLDARSNICGQTQSSRDSGYPDDLLDNILREIKFSERMSTPQIKQKNAQKNFAVCYRTSPICA